MIYCHLAAGKRSICPERRNLMLRAGPFVRFRIFFVFKRADWLPLPAVYPLSVALRLITEKHGFSKLQFKVVPVRFQSVLTDDLRLRRIYVKDALNMI
jgi:hypothetical protein